MSDDRVTATSPTRFSCDVDHIYDPNFTQEINQKMQVPKRIKVNGENEDDFIIGVGGNHPSHNWESEKFEMHVPERILVVDSPETDYYNQFPRKYSSSSSSPPNFPRNLSSDTTVVSVKSNHWRISPSFGVTIPRCDGPLASRPITSVSTRSRSHSSSQATHLQGQEQCVGTKKAPVEVGHENIVLPPDPGYVRVQTPPRVISLAEHYFPAADDMPSPIHMDDLPPSPIVIRANNLKNRIVTSDPEGDPKNEIHHLQREGTPSLTEGMTTNEEIAHLRRQLAKLNRRVMSIELENLQRQQYEKIVYAFGIAYVIWKTLIWLRNS